VSGGGIVVRGCPRREIVAMKRSRGRVVLLMLGVIAPSCGGGDGGSPPLNPSTTPTPVAQPQAGSTINWSDEFDGSAGDRPDAASWSHEIGDGSDRGNPGWGNQELQYYTDAAANAALDGEGHLVITAAAPESDLTCYYGPCLYASARLVTRGKVELTYGRLEARIQVPAGAGLWPAFWALGTDLGQVGWPRAGEIDVMEFVGREPNVVFGTLHGPGYSGGDSFGGTHTFPNGVHEEFHTFAVEWEPEHIAWFVDEILYHEATPADVAPNQWVFDHPFYLILNLAVGGNFGGDVAPETEFPARMVVDYVRVVSSQ
jgi:beta-glucanase (GH16 family)